MNVLTRPGVQGYNPVNKRLEIVTTSNQDPLITHVPIIGVDIWEHAFYLQYLNVKVDVCISSFLSYKEMANRMSTFLQYLNAIWNVINFEEAEKRYTEALAGSKL